MIDKYNFYNFEEKLTKAYPYNTTSFSINSKSHLEILSLFDMIADDFFIKCEAYRDSNIENKKYIIEKSTCLASDQEDFNIIIKINK